MHKVQQKTHTGKIIRLICMAVVMIAAIHFHVFAGDGMDGFLPGGAWEQDRGIIIQADEDQGGLRLPENGTGSSISEEDICAENIGGDPSFDPRDEGLATEVKDQGGFALCWDYAAISTAESVLIRTGRYDRSIDLSEYQTAAYAYLALKDSGMLPEGQGFYEFCMDGGSPYYVWNLWLSGFGPANESDYPSMDTVSQNTVLPEEMEQTHICRLSAVRKISDGVEAVKNEIKQNGAVLALYYSYPLYYNDFVNDRMDSSYYMPYNVQGKNHAISIVGWDDSFPAESFVKDFMLAAPDGIREEVPLPDGAWLVKNSWGKKAYKTPDEASGYYWISYYDRSLSDFTVISFEDTEDDQISESMTEDNEEDSDDDTEENDTGEDDLYEDDPEDDCMTDNRDDSLDEDMVDPDEEDDDTDASGMEASGDFLYENSAGNKEKGQAVHEKPDGRLNTRGITVIPIEPEKIKAVPVAKNIRIKGIVYTIKKNSASVKKCRTGKKKIRIPAYIRYNGRKYPVTKIDVRAFKNNRHVRHIIIGCNIRTISKDAFKGCRKLKRITILA